MIGPPHSATRFDVIYLVPFDIWLWLVVLRMSRRLHKAGLKPFGSKSAWVNADPRDNPVRFWSALIIITTLALLGAFGNVLYAYGVINNII